MANPFAQRLDGVIGARLRPTLAAAGFSGSRRTFRRVRGAFVDLVHVQASQWGSLREGRFTLNVAVYVPQIVEALDEPAHAEPPEYLGHVRRRIGDLVQPEGDRWWDVRDTTDLPALAAEVAGLYASAMEPWFRGIASLADVRRLWSCSPNDLQGVALSLLLDDVASARTDLRILLRMLPPEADDERARAERFGRAHDLLGGPVSIPPE